MRGLETKVAVIVGASTGIGKATALRLAKEGCAVVLGDIDVSGVEAVAAQIAQSGGRASAIACDISDEVSVAAIVAHAVSTYGSLDVMHANAADLQAIMSDTDAVTVPLEILDRTLAVNLRGYFLCTRHAVPELLKGRGGAIIYTSSSAAFAGEAERVAYAMSKAGMLALMRHTASRWGREGIRANAVAPGLVVTDKMADAVDQVFLDQALKQHRSVRLGKVEDIASMVALLASDEGSWINGQAISVDGGATMR